MVVLTDYAQALNDLVKECSEIAASKGFHDHDFPASVDIPRKLALIHSEISEALEAQRENYDDDEVDGITGMTPMQEDDFTEELADAAIRIFDLLGAYEIDNFGEILLTKIEKNRGRPRLHGKRY